MKIFKENIILKSWGVVYVGIKKNWLAPKDVIYYCEQGNISCSEEKMIELYLSANDSLYAFLELIKQFIEKDKKPLIICNEDSNFQDINSIPKEYLHFWEIEFLLRITNSKKDKESKLYEVAAIYEDFNYPDSWKKFLYYMPPMTEAPIGIDALYDNLLTYIDKSLEQLRIQL